MAPFPSHGESLALTRPGADVFVPDGAPVAAALASVTHLGIAAHADDLEIMAYHGIRTGRSEPGARFGAVVCTDGAGAPRSGVHAALTDAQMRDVRRDEQREAARRGGYAVAVQLDHPSASVRDGAAPEVVRDLAAVLAATRPGIVYTHNPMDAHVTHLGVCAAAIDAIRAMPVADRPTRVFGCEGWRGLDWLAGADKTWLDLGSDDAAWSQLIGAFASQIQGGRPYHEGALGRARANGVFREARETGGSERLWLAIDLSPLARDDGEDLADFVRARLDRFAREVMEALARARGRWFRD
jgi:LmbE family N-acetylglucosaminyl deacetylase